MEKTICELFAGVGGFRLGFERESDEWKTVWFSQWEPGKTKQWAHDCYVSHWGDIDENTGIDIALVDKKKIPKHTLLVGGFPCQDYSVARPLPGSKGLEGKKGVLWWQIRDTLEAKKVPFVLLENVDRLVKSPASQRGRDFGVILACFAALNYSVEWRVVNAADYGAAQRRRRIFIYAYKNRTNYGRTCEKDPVEIIGTEGFFAKVFPIEQNFSVSITKLNYKDIPDVSEHFAFAFENAGYMTKGKVYTAKTVPVYEKPIPLKEIVKPCSDPKYYIAENMEKWTYLKGAKKVNRTSKSGHEYVFSEGPIAFPDSLNLPARTMLTSESSVNRSTHVIKDPKSKKLRILTPVEAEQIQGFDPEWTNTGMPEKFRYFCMGNALVVPMITRMANSLDNIISAEG